MTRALHAFAAAALVTASCTTSSSSAPAATPRACVEGLIARMQEDDVRGAARFFAEPAAAQVAKLGAGLAAMDAATRKLAAATDHKLGAGTAAALHIEPRRRANMGKVEIVEVKEEGGRATVKTRETRAGGTPGKESALELTRRDGAWFVSPPHEDPVFGEEVLDMADALHAALAAAAGETDALADDVAAGKIAAPEEIGRRFREISTGIGTAVMSARRAK